MSLIIPFQTIREEDRVQVGGKAFSLAALSRMGMRVPDALCVKAEAYNQFVNVAGLRERILLEVHRKNFQEMRWEEMWDASLRIRNMFLKTPIPPEIAKELRSAIEKKFQDKAVVVRSSAPGEDSAQASFAGLHESYVNIRGTEAILEHLRLVWASLWSDAALLYRQELGLDIERSAMAVLIQEIVNGERSGVAFGKNPNDQSQAVIEAVYGLNAGLVDGTVEPDRWLLDRATGKILSHIVPKREKWMISSGEGIHLEALPVEQASVPPLTGEALVRIFDLVLRVEKEFGAPQDVEWTFKADVLYLLQSRPITTLSTKSAGDKRPWYLSLRRSFENLKVLRQRIEGELIPAMDQEAEHLARQDWRTLSDIQLADEIARRMDIHGQWVAIYWSDFIPFAHGMRLFGQFYNDTVRPEDPYEFMDLLESGQLKSLERNQKLEEMASVVRKDQSLAQRLKEFKTDEDEVFGRMLDEFIQQFGDLSCSIGEEIQCSQGREGIVRLLLEMAAHPPAKQKTEPRRIENLMFGFLDRFEEKERGFASELLDLGRASYRLRDDDNIYLGRIERQLAVAIEEGRRRLEKQGRLKGDVTDPKELIGALKDLRYLPKTRLSVEKVEIPTELKARQIVGQPAGPGIARGKARVIQSLPDLLNFRSGEILVCNAVEPNMTFVVPLSAGIIERRGGMLIHGAIIAREYGIPCVTGIPEATSQIHTGDQVTVDGYLGIVTIE
jgi:phosphoenolpyruvate synthase/pyruvate phosphate dikinase